MHQKERKSNAGLKKTESNKELVVVNKSSEDTDLIDAGLSEKATMLGKFWRPSRQGIGA